MPPRRKKASRKYRVAAAIVKRRDSVNFTLLDMPAELRNIIWEYVLTAPEGIIKIIWEPGKSRRLKKPTACISTTETTPDMPINQLQYVNKQLRAETAGLEVQYNTVHFESVPRKKMGESIQNFGRFTAWMSPSRLLWLTHVIVDGYWYHSPPAPTYSDAFDYITTCSARLGQLLQHSLVWPHIRIDLQVPGFEVTEDVSQFVLSGIAMSHIFRETQHLSIGEQQVPALPFITPLNQWLFEEDIEPFREYTRDNPHLRFFPHDLKSGKERLAKILRETPADTPGAPVTPTSKAMLLYAQGWFLDGI